MKLHEVISWVDKLLDVKNISDISNNGLQIEREGDEISSVAFGVDASVEFLDRAAKKGAQLCIVHHGISWGGGIRRLTGSDFRVVKSAMSSNIALYAVHLPLDLNRICGNNWEIARHLMLTGVTPAFSYHGTIIGLTGIASTDADIVLGKKTLKLRCGQRIGVCSGGAAEFACEAKELGCDLYVTGESSWADEVAAKNMGASLVCCGHYETEIFGVAALAREMKNALNINCECLTF